MRRTRERTLLGSKHRRGWILITEANDVTRGCLRGTVEEVGTERVPGRDPVILLLVERPCRNTMKQTTASSAESAFHTTP